MSKGIIYIMSTIVPGLIKIGKTRSDSYKSRMYNLEHNGYCNVTGLKRAFAIEVEDYDEKESMLHTIFEKSNLVGTELFALNINIAIQLLSSFEGKIIYPENESQENVFVKATEKVSGDGKKNKPGSVSIPSDNIIPDGIYTFSQKLKKANVVSKGLMEVKNGIMYLKSGSILAPESERRDENKHLYKDLKIENNILKEDVVIKSPSTSATIVCGKNSNGWVSWKDKDGKLIDVYRKKKD